MKEILKRKHTTLGKMGNYPFIAYYKKHLLLSTHWQTK